MALLDQLGIGLRCMGMVEICRDWDVRVLKRRDGMWAGGWTSVGGSERIAKLLMAHVL